MRSIVRNDSQWVLNEIPFRTMRACRGSQRALNKSSLKTAQCMPNMCFKVRRSPSLHDVKTGQHRITSFHGHVHTADYMPCHNVRLRIDGASARVSVARLCCCALLAQSSSKTGSLLCLPPDRVFTARGQVEPRSVIQREASSRCGKECGQPCASRQEARHFVAVV